MPVTAYQLGRRPTRHFKSQISRSKPLVNDFPKGRLAASRFALWRTSLSFNRQKSSIVKELCSCRLLTQPSKNHLLVEELASYPKEHPYYTTSRFRCKWGFKRFFIFLKLVAPTGCAPVSVRLKVCDNNCYTKGQLNRHSPDSRP